MRGSLRDPGPSRHRRCIHARCVAWLALFFGPLALACGGPGSARPASTSDEADARELTREAANAWAALDPDRAAELAEQALEAGGGTVAHEIAARARLALGQHREAIAALEGVSSAGLLRLRARAQIAEGDFVGAGLTLARAREEDPWAEAIRPALEALGAGPAYVIEGERSELALEALPLPVVRVRVDGVETLAVVSSATDVLILDPSSRASGGVVDELSLGSVDVRRVPHTVRPLASMSEALGVTIGAAVGADLLLRLNATLDGPGRRLVLRPRPEELGEATTAPFLTLTASVLAVEGRLGEERVWLTVDTAALLPVAVTPEGEALLGDASWAPLEGEARMAGARVRLGALEIEELPVLAGVLGDEHARAVGAPVAGSVGWVLLEQLVVRFDPEGRRLRFE